MDGFSFKVERLRRGLTQWEVARLVDVPPYRLSAFEQGRVDLQPDERDRLKRALDDIEPVIGAK